jgi:hypothetical protein
MLPGSFVGNDPFQLSYRIGEHAFLVMIPAVAVWNVDVYKVGGLLSIVGQFARVAPG